MQTQEFAPEQVPLLAVGGIADIAVPVSSLQEGAAFYGGSVKILPGAANEFFLMDGWQRAAACIDEWLKRIAVAPTCESQWR